MQEITATFTPSEQHLAQIEIWLIEEENYNKEGFYCNWSSIVNAFKKKKIAIALLEDKAVGFMTWFEWGNTATIQIAEVEPKHRKKGYGRMLINAIINLLATKNVFVLGLNCQPAISEKAWERLGFSRFPAVEDFEKENSPSNPHLYKIIVPHLKTETVVVSEETISLWSAKPHQKDAETPRWKWKPKFIQGSRLLVRPIIAPAKPDWNICWTKNDTTIKESKVKYFGKGNIDSSNFIIITELPDK